MAIRRRTLRATSALSAEPAWRSVSPTLPRSLARPQRCAACQSTCGRASCSLCSARPGRSGKTTLLRVIAGLEIPDRGQVFFGGEDATAIPVQKRQVGFVFQHYALFHHLTVAGNIAY